ncbi:MAG: hypothetical protein J7L17_00575 [Thaumarchaeota archaeon]|nr:hypothetical protein [Nitrososphaerota archaeon]
MSKIKILLERLKLTLLAALILMGVLLLGSLIPLGDEEGRLVQEELERLGGEGLELGIFLNNFRIALLGLIPFLGPPILGYAVFHTGRFLGWLGVEQGMPPQLLIPFTLDMIILTGYGILEFLGYGAAAAESLTISYYAIRSRSLLKRELRILPLMVGLSAGFLLAGAVIEASLIRFLEGLGPAT